MEIGLNILDNVRISIGDTLEEIIESLDSNRIKYSIPYSIKNRSGATSVILYIEDYGVELSIHNDEVSYIKSSNSNLNYIMQIHERYPADVIKKIKENLCDRFGVSKKDIRVDRFETSTLNSIISIPYKDNKKIKIVLVMGKDSSMFIETLQII
jgi:hypothetical protein